MVAATAARLGHYLGDNVIDPRRVADLGAVLFDMSGLADVFETLGDQHDDPPIDTINLATDLFQGCALFHDKSLKCRFC